MLESNHLWVNRKILKKLFLYANIVFNLWIMLDVFDTY